MFLKGIKQHKLGLLLAVTLLAGCSVAPKSPISLFGPSLGKFSNVDHVYRGVFHVHTRYSHDSSGSLGDVIKTAQKNRLDFVIVTDHNTTNSKNDPAVIQHNDLPLLIIGNELSTTDGHLIELGTDQRFQGPINPQSAINEIRHNGGYTVLAHPVCEKSYWKDWQVRDFDAIEVYNHACDFYDSNKIGFALKTILLSPSFFAKMIVREPRETLDKWDALMIERQRVIAGIGALDAHERYGFFGFSLMRYTNTFPIATIYVTSETFSEKKILQNLAAGNAYFAFESYGDADGFRFQIQSSSKVYRMGSTADAEIPLTLAVKTPAQAEIRVIHDGKVIKKSIDASLSLDIESPGIYRVEVFKNGKLWIVSNPVLVQA